MSHPAISYPAELPISQRKDDILAAIRDHQVVVVAGETGSGKTTQLPKICLELGRGGEGSLIGHTQPRRLAARTIAQRVSEELGGELGGLVGYQVRFTDRVGPDTRVKLMTDGILLAEIQHDRMLRRYDTLIIDEAHERSLNIDFILGYLKQLLPRRPDLKLIITSATIDPHRFARHFAGPAGDAPVVEVSGRTYPVQMRYRPIGEDRDQIEAIGDAVVELWSAGADGRAASAAGSASAGDVLVFLSGEREIRDTAEALNRLDLPRTEVLPLYARLSTVEQHRVFESHTGRRIVLATNVAETSLTVPGIHYVVDPGTARISRYSLRTKVQRLPIEPVSQASANQRAGRCGRVADGICIRLYDEPDFLARPEFTEPEILRTNLASVILQMTALGLGDVEAFPFLDPPDRRQVRAGRELLHELGALEGERLSRTGRELARLPIDPRLGRMILAAKEAGCLAEVLIIAAGLSIQDPRERPVEQQAAADTAHARFADPDSDFLAYLNLWRYLREQQEAGSSSRFRRLCRAEFLNYLRVREWQDLEGQLRQIAGARRAQLADEPDRDRIHQALLAGLLSHIGLRDNEKREYAGARDARFALWPGSGLAKRAPRWVMAAELVETSRLFGRIAARIDPAWLERAAGHLVRRTYSEPRWDAGRGAVLATERVTLYGLPIVVGRTVNYGRIDPVVSRELFIRHALVEGDWETRHKFFAANRALRSDVEDLEHRARRRDIVVDDEALYEFYDARVGAEVVSARHFDTWWKRTRSQQAHLLDFTHAILLRPGATAVSVADFPDVWEQDGIRLPLSYRFEPGTEDDGVTVHIPLPVLGRLDPAPFEWQVPGLRVELVTALIRALPKVERRDFVPAPDFAQDALATLQPGGSLLDAVGRALSRLASVPPPRGWDPASVPAHLRMTFVVEDEQGNPLGSGKDLAALQERLRPAAREAIEAAGADLARTGARTWDFGTLPHTVTQQRAGYPVTAYPALVDEGASVGVRLFESPAEQQDAMWRGTRLLLVLTAGPGAGATLPSRLSNEEKLALRHHQGPVSRLIADCQTAAVDDLLRKAGGPAWDEAGFARLRDTVRAGLPDALLATVRTAVRILVATREVERSLAGLVDPALVPSLVDIREQLAGLVYPGFVTGAGRHLADLPRYLRAVAYRLEKLPGNPHRDAEQVRRLAEIRREYQSLRDQLTPGHPAGPELEEVRWMLEELRVSWFAQSVGTAYPVSDKRIYRALDELSAE
jgi:ATP-dependent helicase HrpA